MNKFKEELILKINKAKDKVEALKDAMNKLQYRLTKALEQAEDIRIEPTKLGIIKPATTLEDLNKFRDIFKDLKIDYEEEAYRVGLDNSSINVYVESELKRLSNLTPKAKVRTRKEILKTKNNVTICEIDTIKFE